MLLGFEEGEVARRSGIYEQLENTGSCVVTDWMISPLGPPFLLWGTVAVQFHQQRFLLLPTTWPFWEKKSRTGSLCQTSYICANVQTTGDNKDTFWKSLNLVSEAFFFFFSYHSPWYFLLCNNRLHLKLIFEHTVDIHLMYISAFSLNFM